MLLKLAKWGGLAAGGLLGLNMFSKIAGQDMDFMQAYMMNRMSGRGGFFRTFFYDGLRSLFLGSRTASAMVGTGMMPFAGALYGHPGLMGMNPYMMNPMAMGGMPYPPMMMGNAMWGL